MTISRTTTGWFILAVTLTVIVYAILAHVYGNERATVSEVMYDFAINYPMLVFLLGMAVGGIASHWWWPQWIEGTPK